MVNSVGSPVANYQLAVANQGQLLRQFVRTPDYQKQVAYYQKNIGKVTSPEDLLKDRKLLLVALSAFQLESQIDNKGMIRKLLTQDPTDKKALAQRLLDPRFTAFANAFAGLRNDGGKALQAPASIDAVIAGFQSNEYQKWVADRLDDSSLRQALYFSQQVEDKIDISATGKLYADFGDAGQALADVTHFKTAIKTIKSVDALLADSQTLKVALGAYGIDPDEVPTATLKNILNGTLDRNDPLLSADQRFKIFRDNFRGLALGIPLTSKTTIDAIAKGYETNAFTRTVALGSNAERQTTLGAGGSDTAAMLLGDFRQRSGTQVAIDYYNRNIGKIGSADALLKDPQLLDVALGAFNLELSDLGTPLVRQLLTDDPSASATLKAQAAALRKSDPAAADFAASFAAGRSFVAGAGQITGDFEKNRFRQWVAGKLQQSDTAANGKLTENQVLANKTLQAVTFGALGIPSSTAALSVDQQKGALRRAHFDPARLTDPKYLATFVKRFVANAAATQGTGDQTSTGGTALSVLSSSTDDTGTVPVDFNFLLKSGKVNVVA